jgi:hypothetical protein
VAPSFGVFCPVNSVPDRLCRPGSMPPACAASSWITPIGGAPHTFRHTTAMHLLQSGVDITVIALWLGHESPSTTHMYLEADLAMKERALGRLQPPTKSGTRYKPPDRLMQFLQSL